MSRFKQERMNELLWSNVFVSKEQSQEQAELESITDIDDGFGNWKSVSDESLKMSYANLTTKANKFTK